MEVVQIKVVPELKLPGEKYISSSPLYSALHEIVTTLSKDLSWLQALTTKQRFCWAIVASCCEKLTSTTKQIEWYTSFLVCLGRIYNSYWNNLPEKKPTERFSPSTPFDDIKRYELSL